MKLLSRSRIKPLCRRTWTARSVCAESPPVWLRGAKRTEMSIKDAYTGEVVFTKTTYNSRKAYGASGSGGMVDVNFNVAELGLANNKKYTFEMECFLDVEGEQSPSRNTFSFSFYIDNEAPVLVPDETVIKYDTDSTTGKITRRYLELAFYDNHYIQGFFLSSYESVNADGSFVNGRVRIFRHGSHARIYARDDQ